MESAQAQYDVALSFAGEDRNAARQLASGLQEKGYSVFFDEFEKANLWGADLSVKLKRVYKDEARYCVLFVSQHYERKPWTNHERQAALARAFKERQPYILPIRVDDTELPGLSEMIGYLDIRSVSIDEIVALLSQKLGQPASAAKVELQRQLSQAAKDQIREVLAACYRRAIFARMHAQMNPDAMFSSLRECRVELQKKIMFIEPEPAQRLVAGIIAELDFIERRKSEMLSGGYDAYWGLAPQVNSAKIRIITALLELSKLAGISFVMPSSITEEVFFTEQDATAPPTGPESPTMG
jgi:hypothetical protein